MSQGDARPVNFPARFESLDAVRGLAALAVVIHHVATVYIGGPAVMAFFVVSGYCIAGASASARRNDLGMRGFLWRRIRRIMPPYLLSIAFWAVLRIVKAGSVSASDLNRPWIDWLQNLTLTQWTSLLQNPTQYPPHNPTLFVGAYWSLCYEEQFYFFMGLLVAIAGVSAAMSRWIVAALLAVALAWNVAFPHHVYGIFIEYWAPFAFGCLVYYRLCELPRRRSPESTPRTRLAATAIDAFLGLMVGVSASLLVRAGGFPAPGPGGAEFRSIPGELLVASLVALTLLAIRPWDTRIARSLWFQPLQWLGKITFSLYLIHQFNLTAARTVTAKILGADNADTIPGYVLRVAILVAIGSVFWFFCERPFLNKPLPAK